MYIENDRQIMDEDLKASEIMMLKRKKTAKRMKREKTTEIKFNTDTSDLN